MSILTVIFFILLLFFVISWTCNGIITLHDAYEEAVKNAKDSKESKTHWY